MARIIYAPGQYARTGKQGGVVFTKYRNQQVIKQNTIPVLRYSDISNANRQRFAAVVSNYKNLSISQKNTFNNEVSQYPRTTSHGFTYNISGYNLYCSSGINKEKILDSFLNSISPKRTVPSFSPVSVNIDLLASSIIISFSASIVPAHFSLYLLASLPLPLDNQENSAAIFRRFYFADAGATIPNNFFSQYLAKFGSISSLTNQTIYFKYQLIQNDSGQIVKEGLFGENTGLASGFPFTLPFSLA